MAARKSPHLHAVTPDAKPKRKHHTVDSAAREGDRLDLAYAMRDRVAKAISDEKCPPRDLAALTRRLDDIVEKIAVMEAARAEAGAAGGDVEDEAFDASVI